MSEYEYYIYAEDGSVTVNRRTDKFTLKELQTIIGGRIEILPEKIQGIKGFTNVYVVSEDGIYKHSPNASFPNFYGPVLLTNKYLIR